MVHETPRTWGRDNISRFATFTPTLLAPMAVAHDEERIKLMDHSGSLTVMKIAVSTNYSYQVPPTINGTICKKCDHPWYSFQVRPQKLIHSSVCRALILRGNGPPGGVDEVQYGIFIVRKRGKYLLLLHLWQLGRQRLHDRSMAALSIVATIDADDEKDERSVVWRLESVFSLPLYSSHSLTLARARPYANHKPYTKKETLNLQTMFFLARKNKKSALRSFSVVEHNDNNNNNLLFYDASDNEEQEDSSSPQHSPCTSSSSSDSDNDNNKVTLPPSFRLVLPSLAKQDNPVATLSSNSRPLAASQRSTSATSLSSLSSTSSRSKKIRVVQRGNEWWVEAL